MTTDEKENLVRPKSRSQLILIGMYIYAFYMCSTSPTLCPPSPLLPQIFKPHQWTTASTGWLFHNYSENGHCSLFWLSAIYNNLIPLIITGLCHPTLKTVTHRLPQKLLTLFLTVAVLALALAELSHTARMQILIGCRLFRRTLHIKIASQLDTLFGFIRTLMIYGDVLNNTMVLGS